MLPSYWVAIVDSRYFVRYVVVVVVVCLFACFKLERANKKVGCGGKKKERRRQDVVVEQ
jgi:hypothetical protein